MLNFHKRIISALLAVSCAVCVAVSAVPASAEVAVFKRGDVNGDGDVSALDALLALRISLGFDRASSTQLISCDMNSDGVIDSTDALSILKLAVNAQSVSHSATRYRKVIDYNPYEFTNPKAGIDVSFWQEDIDFNAVKASGIDFVIIRAGGATDDPSENHEDVSPRRQGVDERFEQNYAKAKAAGLDVGVYWFSFAETEQEAYREAESCLKAIGGKKLEYPVFYDIENDYQFELGKEFCSSIMKIFCNKVRSEGYYSAFYMSTFFATHYLDDEVKQNYDCWLAQWSGDIWYESDYTMWQYGVGQVNGIEGDVDVDYSYFNYPAYIKKAKLNGYN